MATNGLFTQGTTVEELMAERNKRAFTQQQQMMQQQSARSARPMETQAASLIGSSLGRALAGKMDGGAFEAKAQAKADDKRIAQARYLSASGTNSSAAMFAEVKKLQEDDHMLAAAEMLAMAKKTLKEEKDAEKAAKVLADKNAKDAADKAAQDAKDKAALAYQQQQDTQEQTNWQAEQDGKASSDKSVTTVTAAELNKEEGSAVYPKGSIWQLTASTGALKRLNTAPDNNNILQSVEAGMKPIYDDNNNIIELIPIKGGKQWIAAQKVLKAAEESTLRDDVTEDAEELDGVTINNAISRALEIAETDSLLTPIFGRMNLGKSAGYFEGSARSDLEAQMEPILADAAFDTLKDMRAASKTGGALGAINTAELNLLKAARGALQLSQSKEQWVNNMKKYQTRFNDGLHGSRKAIDRYNKRNPDKVPLVYWGDAKAAAESAGKATKPEVVASRGSGKGPNAQPLSDLTDAQLDAQTQQMLQTSQELTQATSATYTFNPATGQMILSQ